MARINDDNLKIVIYEIKADSVSLKDDRDITITLVFSKSQDDTLNVTHDNKNYNLVRLQNNTRTIVSLDGDELVNTTSRSLRNAIDAIEFGFGLGDLAYIHNASVNEKMTFLNFLGAGIE